MYIYESDFGRSLSVCLAIYPNKGPWQSGPYLYCIQDLYHARVPHCPKFLQRISGEGEGGSVGGDIEGEDTAV
jgi:hypothetical protein